MVLTAPGTWLRRISHWVMVSLAGLIVLVIISIILLRWVDPPISSVMIRHSIQATIHNTEKPVWQWTDWETISPQLPLAIIAAEDQRFPDHHGIDFTELKSALGQSKSKRRGASTLTQQTAKNLYLWHGRSYIRKGLEAGIALTMDLFLSKQRILEIYMNIAQFGPHHYGVFEASQRAFNSSPDRVNRHQAAALAAVLPNPNHYSATKPTKYLKSRQKWILRQMRQLGGKTFLKKLSIDEA